MEELVNMDCFLNSFCCFLMGVFCNFATIINQ